MPETPPELTLNAAKLARLVTHLKDGGERSTKAAEGVLRMKKPNYVSAYIEEAMHQAGMGGEPAGEATPDPVADVPVEPAPPAPAPVEEAPPAEPTPAPAVAPEQPQAAPAPAPAPTTSAKAYRFKNKDGQTIKLKILSETAKAMIFEEDVPKDLVTIMLKGVAVQVDALDPNLSEEFRTAVELARA